MSKISNKNKPTKTRLCPLPQGRFEPHTDTAFWAKIRYAIRQATPFSDLRMLFPDELEIGYNQNHSKRAVVRIYYNEHTNRYLANLRQEGVSSTLQRPSVDNLIDDIIKEITS